MGEESGKFPAARLVPIDEGDPRYAGEAEFDADGPRRPASPEKDDALPLGIEAEAQGLEKSLAVGVFADESARSANDAVHRAHEASRLTQAVEEGDDGDLVGNGAIEPGEAHGPRAAYRLAEVGRIDLDGEVSPVKAVVAEGRLDHGLGGIFGHWLAENGHEFLLEEARRRALFAHRFLRSSR